MANDEYEEEGGLDLAAAERAAIEAESDEDQEEPSEIPPTVQPTRAAEIGNVLAPPTAVAPPLEMPRRNNAPPHAARLQKFGEILNKTMPKVLAVLPKQVSPERLFTIAYVSLERNPKLLECTALSILRGIIIGAQLGLDVSGVGGMAYLVPYFNNKTGKTEAQFIPGWRGLVELARRSGQVSWVYANLVYQNEQFDYSVNPIPKVFHKPLPMIGPQGDRGPCVGAYALAVFRDPAVPPMPHVMTVAEIDRIRQRSKARDNGPWVTDLAEMQKKTPVRALCKYLPQSPDLARALDLEDRVESGLDVSMPELEGMDEGMDTDLGSKPEPAPAGGTARIKDKLARKPKK